MSAVPSRRPPVKVRDIIKYAFALILALVTFGAIAGMEYVKYQRRTRDAAERERIQETLQQYGTDGSLPKKLSPPPAS